MAAVTQMAQRVGAGGFIIVVVSGRPQWHSTLFGTELMSF